MFECLVRILMLTLTLTPFVIVVSAATYEAYPFPSGSWLKYEYYAEADATSQVYLSFVEGINTIEWSKIEIQGTFGVNVTILHVTRFKNETETCRKMYINVKTGEGAAIPIIIASNLKVRDQIYADVNISIDSTTKMSYLGMLRDVNFASYEKSGPFGPDDYHEIVQFFWDKETGILCEMQVLIKGEALGGYVLWKMLLVDASPDILKIWATGNTLATIYILLILIPISIFLAGILSLWKKRKH